MAYCTFKCVLGIFLLFTVVQGKRATITGQNIINCRSFNVQSPKTFSFVGSYKSESSLPVLSLPEIAFVGRSNVGKSSLLNCLTGLNKKLAVESKTPGRTQSINLFKCSDKEGEICVFVDLPGYGFAKMAKDQQNETEGLPYLIVATKCDKITSKSEIDTALTKFGKEFEIYPKLPVKFSSVTGDGKKNVWQAIKGGILGDGSLLSGSLEYGEEDEEDEYIEDEDDDDTDR